MRPRDGLTAASLWKKGNYTRTRKSNNMPSRDLLNVAQVSLAIVILFITS